MRIFQSYAFYGHLILPNIFREIPRQPGTIISLKKHPATPSHMHRFVVIDLLEDMAKRLTWKGAPIVCDAGKLYVIESLSNGRDLAMGQY